MVLFREVFIAPGRVRSILDDFAPTMLEETSSRASFDDSDTRHDEMHSSIRSWATDLVDHVESAAASDEFQEWLDVHSRFHDYSHRNTLLIKQQCPSATHVAGYRTWQTDFDRHVSGGESAIWIWAPIITNQCPACENSPSYHADSDCDYDEMPPEEWPEGLVGFKPTPVFDVSQTEGEPLPELDTTASGDGDSLLTALFDAAESLGTDVRIVPESDWTNGDARGVCTITESHEQPVVKAVDRANQADLAATLIHEYAHAQLHVGVDDDTARKQREVEAEAVAYVVGRYFDLDMSGSAFYLAAWNGDDSEAIVDRLDRISRTASTVIEAVDDQ